MCVTFLESDFALVLSVKGWSPSDQGVYVLDSSSFCWQLLQKQSYSCILTVIVKTVIFFKKDMHLSAECYYEASFEMSVNF